MTTEVSEKALHLAQIFLFCQRLPTTKFDIFIKLNFDLNQTSDLLLIQNYEVLNFEATEMLHTFVKDWKKALKLSNM